MFSRNNIIILKISKLRTLSSLASTPVIDYNFELGKAKSNEDFDKLESDIDKDILKLTNEIKSKNDK